MTQDEEKRLFQLDAEDFVRQHHTAMYPLLPTMLHVRADLIDQVMQELAALYRDDEVALAQQFTWMQLLLERTGTIDDREKEKIKGRLAMFDQLWEESPMVQRMREAMVEQYRTQFRQEGHQEGIQALQHALVNVVRARYPDLAEFAQERASHIDKLESLELLIPQLAVAPDAETVRKLLAEGGN